MSHPGMRLDHVVVLLLELPESLDLVALSAESIPSDAQALLAAGTVVGGDWSVEKVTGTQVVLRSNKSFGFLIFVR